MPTGQSEDANMKLTDTFLRGVKPSGFVKKYSDGEGLYLHVSPTGGRLWRMAYRFGGKQKTLSFGAYPDVPLSEARKFRLEAKGLLAKGIVRASEDRICGTDGSVAAWSTKRTTVILFG